MTEQRSMTGTAREEAADVARTAQQSGGQVASTAGEQVSRVTSEAAAQARDLLKEGRGQLTEQAREGQRKAASGLRALSDQLRQMADKSEGQGVAPEVARQAADRTGTLASWLEDRQPGDLVDEVRRFARRKPGVFLAGAALAGVVVGRLTRGIVEAEKSGDGSSSHNANGHRPQQADSPRHAAHSGGPVPTPPPPATDPGPGYGAVPPAPPAPSYANPSAPGYSTPAPGYSTPAPGYSTPPAPGYSTPPGEVR